MDTLNFIKRGRGTVLLHEGCEYYVKRKHSSGLSVWVCKRRTTCGGRLRIKDSTIIDEEPHNCLADHAKNEIDLSIYNCKVQLTSPDFPSVPTKYNAMVSDLENAGLTLVSNIPSFISVKSSMYRFRNKGADLDKLQSKRAAEVVVPEKYERFLFADYLSNNKRIIIFASRQAISRLGELNDYYGDGTFRSCPAPFHQLYTIHGDLGSNAQHTNVVPLLYVLMSDRKAETYVTLFNLIRARIPEWNPRKFKIDYEKAVMKALAIVFPHTEVKGCYFHFCKAIWKKGRDLGIIRSHDPQKIKKVSLSAVLALLPETEIMNGWIYITTQEHNEDPAVNRFQAYMERQWLRGNFPRMWCAFSEQHRTTNSLEAWHSKLNRAMNKKSPNLMHFLHVVNQDASYYTANYNQLRRNHSLKKRLRKHVLTDEIIQDAQLELVSGNISVGHFLETLRR